MLVAFIICQVLCFVKFLVRLFFNLVIKKRKIRKEAIKRNVLQPLIYLLCIIVLIYILSKNCETVVETDPSENDNETTQVSSPSYSAKAEEKIYSITFDPENINQESVLWENLLDTELGMSSYTLWVEETDTFEQLKANYYENFIYNPVIPYADYNELMEYCSHFSGTSFLPYSDCTLEEIDRKIPPPELRHTASPDLFMEELYLRLQLIKPENIANIYQIGRCSDDILKQLVANKQINMKQLIFYASIAITCYRLVLDEMERDPSFSIANVDTGFLNYRMAEIFIYLDEYFPTGDEAQIYHTHFKLCAESCLARVQYEYETKEITDDINAIYPYFDSYYAEILYDYVTIYKDNEVIDSFYQHADRYIQSAYSKIENEKSCTDLKKKMDLYKETVK